MVFDQVHSAPSRRNQEGMHMHVFQEIPTVALSSIQPVPGWRKFLEDGRDFLATAAAAYAGRKKVFTPEILYNIIAMAIEKFVMAALMRQGTMPCNHTMADLVEAVEEILPGVLGEIREGLLHLDTYQDICDPDDFALNPPDMEDIPGMLDLAGRLQSMVENRPAHGDAYRVQV